MSDNQGRSPAPENTAPSDFQVEINVGDPPQIDGAGDASLEPPKEVSGINTTGDVLSPPPGVKANVSLHEERSLYMTCCSVGVCLALVATIVVLLCCIGKLINAHPALSLLAAILNLALSVIAIGSTAPGEVCSCFAYVVGTVARIFTAGFNAGYSTPSNESDSKETFERAFQKFQKDSSRAADSWGEIAKWVQTNTTTQRQQDRSSESSAQQPSQLSRWQKKSQQSRQTNTPPGQPIVRPETPSKYTRRSSSKFRPVLSPDAKDNLREDVQAAHDSTNHPLPQTLGDTNVTHPVTERTEDNGGRKDHEGGE
jgi:hypothetical protein